MDTCLIRVLKDPGLPPLSEGVFMNELGRCKEFSVWSITSFPHIWKASPVCLNKAAGGRPMYPGSATLSITARRRTFPEVLSWPQQGLWLHAIQLMEFCPRLGHPSLRAAHQAGLAWGWDTWIIPGARPPMVMSLSLPLPSFLVKSESCSAISDSFQPHGLYSPWNSPGQDTGVGNLCLLQGIFPSQGSNPGLLHCRRILYQLSHKGSPTFLVGMSKFTAKIQVLNFVISITFLPTAVACWLLLPICLG